MGSFQLIHNNVIMCFDKDEVCQTKVILQPKMKTPIQTEGNKAIF